MGISLITAEELKKPRSDRIIVDARLRKQYDAGRIPGAIWLRWEEWCERAPDHVSEILKVPGYWGRLADPVQESFAQRLEQRGISSDAEIVVYAAGPRSKGSDGRVAWMHLYLGVKNVRLLDCAWQEWVSDGGAIETEIKPVAGAKFAVNVQPQRRALLRDCRQRIIDRQVLLIDTRTAREFSGEIYDYQPRKGSLPGATLISFSSMYSTGRKFVTGSEYQAMLPADADDKAVITYCEVGVRAATVALLHEIHQQRIVQVYDGSVMEWALDPTLPVCGESTLSLSKERRII
jgi:thiosulfate/3-mercaptopyruvate sulfurtransferase